MATIAATNISLKAVAYACGAYVTGAAGPFSLAKIQSTLSAAVWTGLPSAGQPIGLAFFAGKVATPVAAVANTVTGLVYTSGLGTVTAVDNQTGTVTYGGATYTVTASDPIQYGSLASAFNGGMLRTFGGWTGAKNVASTYIGTGSLTDTTATVHRGMSLGINLPVPVTMTSYTVYQCGTDDMHIWVVLASNTGTAGSWVLLDSVTVVPIKNNPLKTTIPVAKRAAYTFYRLLVKSTYGIEYQQGTLYVNTKLCFSSLTTD
jgi:hypothetical protein